MATVSKCPTGHDGTKSHKKKTRRVATRCAVTGSIRSARRGSRSWEGRWERLHRSSGTRMSGMSGRAMRLPTRSHISSPIWRRCSHSVRKIGLCSEIGRYRVVPTDSTWIYRLGISRSDATYLCFRLPRFPPRSNGFGSETLAESCHFFSALFSSSWFVSVFWCICIHAANSGRAYVR